MKFDVITTSSVPTVVFQLFSKGLLKISKIIKLDKQQANFTIIPKFSYTPKAQCIVFFVDGSGEIVSDSITLHFEGVLSNYVSFQIILLNFFGIQS